MRVLGSRASLVSLVAVYLLACSHVSAEEAYESTGSNYEAAHEQSIRLHETAFRDEGALGEWTHAHVVKSDPAFRDLPPNALDEDDDDDEETNILVLNGVKQKLPKGFEASKRAMGKILLDVMGPVAYAQLNPKPEDITSPSRFDVSGPYRREELKKKDRKDRAGSLRAGKKTGLNMHPLVMGPGANLEECMELCQRSSMDSMGPDFEKIKGPSQCMEKCAAVFSSDHRPPEEPRGGIINLHSLSSGILISVGVLGVAGLMVFLVLAVLPGGAWPRIYTEKKKVDEVITQ